MVLIIVKPVKKSKLPKQIAQHNNHSTEVFIIYNNTYVTNYFSSVLQDVLFYSKLR